MTLNASVCNPMVLIPKILPSPTTDERIAPMDHTSLGSAVPVKGLNAITSGAMYLVCPNEFIHITRVTKTIMFFFQSSAMINRNIVNASGRFADVCYIDS